MIRTRFLDQGSDTILANSIMQAIEEEGYSSEEAIPGLILAVILLAELTNHPEECLDEAANLLADGPSNKELWGV